MLFISLTIVDAKTIDNMVHNEKKGPIEKKMGLATIVKPEHGKLLRICDEI